PTTAGFGAPGPANTSTSTAPDLEDAQLPAIRRPLPPARRWPPSRRGIVSRDIGVAGAWLVSHPPHRPAGSPRARRDAVHGCPARRARSLTPALAYARRRSAWRAIATHPRGRAMPAPRLWTTQGWRRPRGRIQDRSRVGTGSSRHPRAPVRPVR